MSFDYNLPLLDPADADALLALGTLLAPLDDAVSVKQEPNYAPNAQNYPANQLDNFELHFLNIPPGQHHNDPALQQAQAQPRMEEQLQLNVPSQIVATDFAGNFDFEVYINPHHGKKSPWVYSSALQKIFITINQVFPIDFKCKFPTDDKKLFIRATPVYSDTQHKDQVVTRCTNHAHDNESNKGCSDSIRDHIIRCQDRNAFYGGSKDEHKHLYVRVPLHAPPSGSDSRLLHYQFMCKNSCTGRSGMNRRAIEVVFTLEDELEQILGRRVLKVRICSCPKRDKESAEKAYYQKDGEPQPPGKKRRLEKKPLSGSQESSETKVCKLEVSLPSSANAMGAMKAVHDYLAGEMLLGKVDPALGKKCVEELQQKMNAQE